MFEIILEGILLIPASDDKTEAVMHESGFWKHLGMFDQEDPDESEKFRENENKIVKLKNFVKLPVALA